MTEKIGNYILDSQKILLVDDDPMILSSYERSLQQFSIETARGAPEALDKIASGQPYAVVLSDLRMPGMDGLTFLRRVHESSPHSVCILLTGNADLRSAIEAINQGHLFRYLEKPYPSQSMVKVLIDALKQYRLVISERTGSMRPAFNAGDEIIVIADCSRQGQHGIVEQLLPALEEHGLDQVCIVTFRAAGVISRGHYFVKEIRSAPKSSEPGRKPVPVGAVQ